MRYKLGLLAGALLCALVWVAPAQAQQVIWANVVSACGTPNSTPVAGNPYQLTIDTTGKLCTSGSGGGGGGSVTQGTTPWIDDIIQWANVALGAPSNYGTSPGAVAVPGVNAAVTQTTSPANVTPTDCSGTITTGGTAQNAFTAQTTLHGFTIANIDAATNSGEVMNISFTGTAAAATAGSYPLAAPTATTLANLSSFTSPPGFGTNHALSVIAATTGHKFSCTWW